MSSTGIVTSVVTETPQILVIGEGELLDRLVARLRQIGFEVTIRTWHSWSVEDLDFPWYKIFWTYQPADDDQVIQAWLAAALSSHHHPLLIIPTPTLIEVSDDWSAWGIMSQRWRYVVDYVASLDPDWGVIVLRDMVTLEPAREWWPWSAITAHLSKALVTDPQISITPFEMGESIPLITQLALDPQPPRVILTGKAVSTPTLAERLQRDLMIRTNQRLEVVKKPAQSRGFETHLTLRRLSSGLSRGWWLHQLDLLRVGEPEPEVVVPPPIKTIAQASPKKTATTVFQPPPALATVQAIQSVNQPPPPLVSPSTDVSRQRSTHPEVKKDQQSPAVSRLKPDLDQAVEQLFSQQRQAHHQDRAAALDTFAQRWQRLWQRRRRVMVVGTLLFVVAITVLVQTALWSASTSRVKSSITTSLNQPSPHYRSSLWLRVMKTQLGFWGALVPTNWTAEAGVLAQVDGILASITDTQTRQQEIGFELYQAVWQPEMGPDPIPVYGSWQSALQSTHQALAELVGVLKNYTWLGGTPSTSSPFLTRYSLNSAFLQVLPTLSELIGVEGQKQVLIVFQNDQELRPTGGFIEALGLLTFQDGRLVRTQVWDSYTLDAQQLGAATPPADLTQILGENQWFIRDGNWSPDFPTTAQTLADLVNRASSSQVSVVVGLTPKVVGEVLAVTGPLEVPTFNEVVTQRNLDERLRFHSDISVAGGEPAFSAEVLEGVLSQLGTLSFEQALDINQRLGQQLQQGQLLVAPLQPDLLTAFNQVGWSGAVRTPTCPPTLPTPCQPEFVYQVETNVGVNKVNPAIRREVSQVVEISPTGLQQTRTISLTNTAQTATWPDGPYRVYLRLLVPPAAKLTQARLNTTPLPADVLVAQTTPQWQSWGWVVEVPPNQQRTLTISYTTPLPDQPTSLALFDQLQPGLRYQKRQLEFQAPVGKNFTTLTSEPLDSSSQRAVFSLPLDQSVGVGAAWNP